MLDLTGRNTMKSIRKLMAVWALAFVLSSSALAGNVQTPGGADPPPPPPPPQVIIRAIVDQLLAAFLFHKA
jgi:hypothetical protein